MHHQRALFLFIPLLLVSSTAWGQKLWGHTKDGSDEGTWEGCGPYMTVQFSDEITGPLHYRFEPELDTPFHTVFNTVWSVFDGDFNQWFEDTLEHTFPVPGEHLVCLTANAMDLSLQPCSTTTCRVVPILQDASCADLVVDFTISSMAGQQITFQDLSSYPGGIITWQWDFGDANLASGSSPTHVFQGPGPHKICLSVTGAGSAYCTAKICKWLYLGPVPVACDQLFSPGFLVVQALDMVGALDTSSTSGMHHEVEWDFGDGSPLGSGRFALHAYAQGGQYDLCSTVRFWGPLVADTCYKTHCVPITVAVTSTPEELAGQMALGAHPVPFADRLWLTGLAHGAATLRVLDATGRVVHEVRGHADGPMPLDLGHLRPGAYVIRCLQKGGEQQVRVLRNP
ncbi:MAG: PKD domain-containing protein [Flavobacteriales bacterium]|nr:PKD domain-containing protein [Flavobacteriales bacterium]